jgi:hypothetical protein
MAALIGTTAMKALAVALQNTENELEDDMWMMCVSLPCPDPEFHELTGVCHECSNKYYELKDKDVPVLAAFMRLAMSSKKLYKTVRSYTTTAVEQGAETHTSERPSLNFCHGYLSDKSAPPPKTRAERKA